MLPAAVTWEKKSRRRLGWGGDMPEDWVGTSWRWFGGSNYGYKMPPGTTIATGVSTAAYCRSSSILGASQTLLVLVAALSISVSGGLLATGAAFALNEFSGFQSEVLLISEPRGQFNLPDLVRRTPKRTISGSSGVFNYLGGFLLYYLVYGKPSWFATIACLATVGTSVLQLGIDIYTKVTNPEYVAAISHWTHFTNMFGGFFAALYLRQILPGAGFALPAFATFVALAWVAFNLLAEGPLSRYFTDVDIEERVVRLSTGRYTRSRARSRGRLPFEVD